VSGVPELPEQRCKTRQTARAAGLAPQKPGWTGPQPLSRCACVRVCGFVCVCTLVHVPRKLACVRGLGGVLRSERSALLLRVRHCPALVLSGPFSPSYRLLARSPMTFRTAASPQAEMAGHSRHPRRNAQHSRRGKRLVWDAVPCGIPCCAGYHALRDTMDHRAVRDHRAVPCGTPRRSGVRTPLRSGPLHAVRCNRQSVRPHPHRRRLRAARLSDPRRCAREYL
jgi:hypothetical protein